VPAADRGTLFTGVGEITQHGAVAFTTTRWSIVLAAQDSSPAADEALEKLCRSLLVATVWLCPTTGSLSI